MSSNTLNHSARPALQTGLTATGSSQTTAYPLTNNTLHEFTITGASTGCVLPVGTTPSEIAVYNGGISVLSVYPPLGGTIDGNAANSSVSIASGNGATYWAATPTAWHSLQTAATGAGTGTVTSIATGTGLAGGPVTTSGTLSLATIPTLNVLANTTGGTAAPAGVTLSSVIDAALGATQGDVLYRGSGGWAALAPGTSGQVLTSGGAAANPSWAAGGGGGGSGTVNSGTSGQVAYYASRTTAVSGESLTALLDTSIASTQGDVLYRGASTWSALAPGTSGQVLTTGGAAANPSWTTVTGTGTVTSVASGTGLTGGPVTTTGTLSLATIPTLNILANTTGGTAAPAGVTLSAAIDAAIGSTQGDILYRNSSIWTPLAPGTSGQLLTSGGSAANPSWTSASGTGTVNSGTTGQLAYYPSSAAAVSGETLSALIDAAIASTQGDILYRDSSSWLALAPGTSGQLLTSGGAAANPSWTTAAGTGTVTSGTAGQATYYGANGTTVVGNPSYLLPSTTSAIRKAGGCIFSCGSCGAVVSTAAATTIFSGPTNSVGSLTIPSSTLVLGNRLSWTLWGLWGCSLTSTPTISIQYFLNGVAILTQQASTTFTVAQTTVPFYSTIGYMQIQAVGASASAGGIGTINFVNPGGGTLSIAAIPGGGSPQNAITFASNASVLFDIKITFSVSSASNTFMVESFQLFLDN
jgi:hypothetical protein